MVAHGLSEGISAPIHAQISTQQAIPPPIRDHYPTWWASAAAIPYHKHVHQQANGVRYGLALLALSDETDRAR